MRRFGARLAVVAPVLAVGSVAFARPAFAASARSGSIVASTSVSSGPVILLGVAVVLAVVLGFAFAVTSRRKKPPTQCAEQRSAFESAEQALLYWEAAVAHLQSVEHHPGASGAEHDATPEAYRYGRTASMSDQEFEALVKKAVDGRDAAAKHRDQCQIDLIVCMGQNPTTAALATPGMSAYERPANGDLREDSSRHLENS